MESKKYVWLFPRPRWGVPKKETSNEFILKIGTSRVLAFFLFFADILFSKDKAYLKRRRVLKYLRNLRVLILAFYPIFHTDELLQSYLIYISIADLCLDSWLGKKFSK